MSPPLFQCAAHRMHTLQQTLPLQHSTAGSVRDGNTGFKQAQYATVYY